jgi:hypothetical protein
MTTTRTQPQRRFLLEWTEEVRYRGEVSMPADFDPASDDAHNKLLDAALAKEGAPEVDFFAVQERDLLDVNELAGRDTHDADPRTGT